MHTTGRAGILFVIASISVAACSMSEEVRRIEAVRRAELRHQESSSTNLSGEQIFIRSCNTCHPGGRQGMGPSLDKLNDDFKADEPLRGLIRKGKGSMPAQSKEALNDAELDNLVTYLRALSSQLAASTR